MSKLKRYKVSIDYGAYRNSTDDDFGLYVPGCVQELILNCECDIGKIGQVIVPVGNTYRVYDFMILSESESEFPDSIVDRMHCVAAECRAMAEELRQLDYYRFWQTAAVIGTCAARLTAAIKREQRRGMNLCRFHESGCSGEPSNSGLNPDCSKCEDIIDRRNAESESESESGFESEPKRMLCVWHSDGKTGVPCGRVNYLDSECSECRNILNAESAE